MAAPRRPDIDAPLRAGPLLLAALFVAVFVLGLLFPPTGDDWSRVAFQNRTPAGFLAQAVGSYEGHNGRIVGNSLSFLLIEPVWVRAAAKAATVVGLVVALQAATRVRAAWASLAAFAGVFLLPAGLFRESYVWSAGFYNYVPPMVAVLLLVAVLGGRRDQVEGLRRVWLAVGWATLGFVACLFVEHVTVAILALSLVGVGAPLLVRRAPEPDAVGWAVGSVLGTVVMFASPGLREVAAHEDAYFSYAASIGDLVDRAIVNYAVITDSFVLSNPVLLVLTAAALVGAAVVRPGRTGAAGWFVLAGVAVVVGWAAVSRLALAEQLRCTGPAADSCTTTVLGLDVAVLFLLLAALVVAGLDRLVTARERRVWLALLGATVLMLGPLLAVSPIGPRNLIGPTVTLTALLVLLARPAVDAWARPRAPRLLAALVGACTLAGLVLLLVIHGANARTAAERVRLMEDAVANRQPAVALPAFPFPSWVHDASDEKIGNRYYLERPRDIEVTFP